MFTVSAERHAKKAINMCDPHGSLGYIFITNQKKKEKPWLLITCLAVFQYALDDIDPLIIRLCGINIRQEYVDWVANLPADLPGTLSPPLLTLNNKTGRLVIDCDLCRIRIKGGSIAPSPSVHLPFPLHFKADGTDGCNAESRKHISQSLFDAKTKRNGSWLKNVQK